MPNFGPSPARPTIMGGHFSAIPSPQIQRSSFQRNSGHKTTFDAGWLIPIYCDEVLPGDTMVMRASFFARLQTLFYPIMDNLYLDTFWFYVPYRILWTNFERFLGAQDTPGSSIAYLLPTVDIGGVAGGFAIKGIYDYFGLPTGLVIAEADEPCSLPFRAYNKIYNDWFRDQNLQGKATENTGDGPDTRTDYALLRRGKRPDYFTTCLPSPQRGTAISVPIGTSAPVRGNAYVMGFTDASVNYGLKADATGILRANTDEYGRAPGNVPTGSGTNAANLDLGVVITSETAKSGMYADLSLATAATINQLREAFGLHQYLELDARGGTRYTEVLMSHWGVTAPDFRLQRPEYLGGGSVRIGVNQVPQTSNLSGGDYPGDLAGQAQVGAGSGFNRSFVEHGCVICLVSVRADITYQERIERMWTRRTRYDVYDPLLAHLSEQAVLNREIWYANNGTGGGTVFGYQERWAEYRSKLSLVTGLFRSDSAGTLDPWHLAIDYDSQPVLDANFIQDQPPLSRVLTIAPDANSVFLDAFFNLRHVRAMPVYSVPGLARL